MLAEASQPNFVEGAAVTGIQSTGEIAALADLPVFWRLRCAWQDQAQEIALACLSDVLAGCHSSESPLSCLLQADRLHSPETFAIQNVTHACIWHFSLYSHHSKLHAGR